MGWAGSGLDRSGQELAGNGEASSSRSHALRAPQRADDRSGRGSIANALTAGLEEPPRLEDYFEVSPAADPAAAPTVLISHPAAGQDDYRPYRRAGVNLFIAREEREPLGADPELFCRLVQAVNPDYLEIFVNEKVDAALLDSAVTPRLKGIHSMGVGFGNIDLAAAVRRGIHPTYVGGDENPLRWATAEMAEALALAGRFDLLRRIEPATAETPKKQLLGEVFRALARKRGMKDHAAQQILWAQLMRQMRKLDAAGRLVRDGRARGAGNGPLRTIEGHQLAADLKGSGIRTSLGFLPGSALDVARWAALARAHGVHELFYTGVRYSEFETAYSELRYEQSVFGVLRQSDYVLRAPDGPPLLQESVDSAGAGRHYPWLVDPDRLALTVDPSSDEVKKLSDSSLDGITVGVLGLGSIGSIAAADLKPMGAHLLSVMGHGKKIEGVDYVGLPELVARSDVLILALPETEETKGILTPEILNGIDPNREVVIVNVGRGTAVGATPEEEQAFAAWLKAHPNVRYYTDVLRSEFLSNAEQLLLDPALAAQVFYSGHIASNTADPNGHRTRSAMSETRFKNFQADLQGKPPPNPVPMPAAGLEEGVRSVLVIGADEGRISAALSAVGRALPEAQRHALVLRPEWDLDGETADPGRLSKSDPDTVVLTLSPQRLQAWPAIYSWVLEHSWVLSSAWIPSRKGRALGDGALIYAEGDDPEFSATQEHLRRLDRFLRGEGSADSGNFLKAVKKFAVLPPQEALKRALEWLREDESTSLTWVDKAGAHHRSSPPAGWDEDEKPFLRGIIDGLMRFSRTGKVGLKLLSLKQEQELVLVPDDDGNHATVVIAYSRGIESVVQFILEQVQGTGIGTYLVQTSGMLEQLRYDGMDQTSLEDAIRNSTSALTETEEEGEWIVTTFFYDRDRPGLNAAFVIQRWSDTLFAGLEEMPEAKVRGAVFLVFDEALGRAMTNQLASAGAEVFIMAETPETARNLISRGISPQRIVGGLSSKAIPERDAVLTVGPEDYWKIDPEIRRFAVIPSEKGQQGAKWRGEFAEKMQEGMGRPVMPIYGAEQMTDRLSALGVPRPMIQRILDQQAGMEEATAGEA